MAVHVTTTTATTLRTASTSIALHRPVAARDRAVDCAQPTIASPGFNSVSVAVEPVTVVVEAHWPPGRRPSAVGRRWAGSSASPSVTSRNSGLDRLFVLRDADILCNAGARASLLFDAAPRSAR